MAKTLLITGATDGIGLETAKVAAGLGHTLLIHGRSDGKLAITRELLSQIDNAGEIETYRADLSRLEEVQDLASAVSNKRARLDVLINNAGVFKLAGATTENGVDLRFVVNTIAPYLLTKKLLPLMTAEGRVVNLSSAAQSPVDLHAFAGKRSLTDNEAYSQSKLALTMWSFHLAKALAGDGPAIIAVNPASFLASKMVKEAYGRQGNDLGIGADVLIRAALSEEFANASGKYFDNDRRQFSSPHADALDSGKTAKLVAAIEASNANFGDGQS